GFRDAVSGRLKGEAQIIIGNLDRGDARSAKRTARARIAELDTKILDWFQDRIIGNRHLNRFGKFPVAENQGATHRGVVEIGESRGGLNHVVHADDTRWVRAAVNI